MSPSDDDIAEMPHASDEATADGGDAPPAEVPKRPLFRRLPKSPPEPEAPAGSPAEPDDQPTGVVEPPSPPLDPGRIRRERRRLLERRQESVYHLGGLAFELYRRDMLAEPVLRRRAEDVADIDRSVLEIDERLSTLDEERRTQRAERREERRLAKELKSRPSGYCLSCGTPYRDPTNFCANCGSPIVRPVEDAAEPAEAGDAGVSDDPTEVIPGTPAAKDSE